MVALVKEDETVKFLSEYFLSYRENILKPLVSVPLAQRELIAADGQNIRATRSSKDGNDSRKNGGYDVVSLFSSTYGVTLCQRTVDKKNNEALAIMEMIKDLNLANSILTFDAINTRAATLKAVTEADADFLVCLKSNQGYLYEEVCDSFTFADSDRYLGEVLSSKEFHLTMAVLRKRKSLSLMQSMVCLKKCSVNGLTLKALSELTPQELINAQVSPIQMM